MNLIEAFALLGVGVLFVLTWIYGGRWLTWLEGVEARLDDDSGGSRCVCDAGVPWCECGHYPHVPVVERSSGELLARVEAEMRRRGHRGGRAG